MQVCPVVLLDLAALGGLDPVARIQQRRLAMSPLFDDRLVDPLAHPAATVGQQLLRLPAGRTLDLAATPILLGLQGAQHCLDLQIEDAPKLVHCSIPSTRSTCLSRSGGATRFAASGTTRISGFALRTAISSR